MELERHSSLETNEFFDKIKELINYASMVNSLDVRMQKLSEEDKENVFIFYTNASLKNYSQGN
jgi:hypothetical protein